MLLLTFLGLLLTNYNTNLQINYYKYLCPQKLNPNKLSNLTNLTNLKNPINLTNLTNLTNPINNNLPPLNFECGCSPKPYYSRFVSGLKCDIIDNRNLCCDKLLNSSGLTKFQNIENCSKLNSSVWYYASCYLDPILEDKNNINIRYLICFIFIGLVIFSIVSTTVVVMVVDCKEKLRRRRIKQKDIELNTIIVNNKIYDDDDEDDVLLFQ